MLSLYAFLSSVQSCVEYWNTHYCIPFFVGHGVREISDNLEDVNLSYAEHLNKTGTCYDIRSAVSKTTANANSNYFWLATETNGQAVYSHSLNAISGIVKHATAHISEICSTITQPAAKQACLAEATKANLMLDVCEHPPLFGPPDDNSASSNIGASWLQVAVPLMATAYLIYSSSFMRSQAVQELARPKLKGFKNV